MRASWLRPIRWSDHNAQSDTGWTPSCDAMATRCAEGRTSFVPHAGEVAVMTRCRGAFAGLFLALAMFSVAGTPADARGIEWCVKDPIFEIDGRVVRVELLVPTTHRSAAVHFVLAVPQGSQATWRLPEGEVLNGTVTIVTDDQVGRDTPLLRVTGEGPQFNVRVQISGDGLRSDPYETRGTSAGTVVPLRLVRVGK